MVYEFLIPGFEVVEATTPVDLLRRGGVELTTVSLGDTLAVESSSGISVLADAMFADCDFAQAQGVILPGGPGTKGYLEIPALMELLKTQYDAGHLVAAICAAPMVLAKAGIEVQSTIYPSLKDEVKDYHPGPVCQAGNVITGNAVGGSIPFSLAVLTYLRGKVISKTIAHTIVV